MKGRDTWNLGQYEKFRNERSQPFFDLLKLVDLPKGGRAIDLGCGPGAMTLLLHSQGAFAETVGIDNSDNMLAKVPSAPGLSFRNADILEFEGDEEWDLITSNAALQWVPDHGSLFRKMRRALKSGGQIVHQIPNNGSHPSQSVAYELESEPRFSHYAPNKIDSNVLSPEGYAEYLDILGFEDINVFLKVYMHHLEDRTAVIEWVRGTFLTHYEREMNADDFAEFMAAYSSRLLTVLPDQKPFLFTFRRLFISARKP